MTSYPRGVPARLLPAVFVAALTGSAHVTGEITGNMPLLFSYGTLQRADVQRATFGRLLSGQPDGLPGFEPSRVKIEDAGLAAAAGATHHDNVIFNGRSDSRVPGTAFEITDAELAAADEYERPAAYTRRAVVLASGRQAWVYCHRSRDSDQTG